MVERVAILSPFYSGRPDPPHPFLAGQEQDGPKWVRLAHFATLIQNSKHKGKDNMHGLQF